MLNRVKSFSKIQLENDDRFLGLLALVDVFEGPCQTILDGSALEEPILIFVDAFENYPLQMISQKFG
jgi:hypothetical protein